MIALYLSYGSPKKFFEHNYNKVDSPNLLYDYYYKLENTLSHLLLFLSHKAFLLNQIVFS